MVTSTRRQGRHQGRKLRRTTASTRPPCSASRLPPPASRHGQVRWLERQAVDADTASGGNHRYLCRLHLFLCPRPSSACPPSNFSPHSADSPATSQFLPVPRRTPVSSHRGLRSPAPPAIFLDRELGTKETGRRKRGTAVNREQGVGGRSPMIPRRSRRRGG